MKRFLRFFGIIGLVLIVAIVGAVFYFSSNVDAIVANLIEEQGSAATGTAVRVDGVSINLSGATGSVKGLTVANPEGFSGESAIEFGDLQLRLNAGSILEEPIIIENIEGGDAMLRIEQTGTRNNLQALLDNLRKDEPEPENQDGGKRVVIERFALTDASASLSVADLDEQRSVDIPDVVLTDIGRRSGGATGAELARQILEPIIRRSLESSAVDAVEERVRDELGERAGDLLDRLGGGRSSEEDDEKPNGQ